MWLLSCQQASCPTGLAQVPHVWARPGDPRLLRLPTMPCCIDDAFAKHLPLFSNIAWGASAQLVKSCHGRQNQALRYIGSRARHDDTRETLVNMTAPLRIVFIGDSVTQQLYQAFLCYVGAKWEFPHMSLMKKAYVEAGMPALFGNYVHAAAPRGGDGYIDYWSTNGHSPAMALRLLRHLGGRVDLVVLEAGAVHHNYDRVDFERHARELYTHCLEMLGRDACLVREPTPQHFANTVDGNYGLTGGYYEDPKGHCLGFHQCHHPNNTWRVDTVRTITSELGLPLLPVYDALASRGEGNPLNQKDCTHYPMDQELWEPVLLALLPPIQRASNAKQRRNSDLQVIEDKECKLCMDYRVSWQPTGGIRCCRGAHNGAHEQQAGPHCVSVCPSGEKGAATSPRFAWSANRTVHQQLNSRVQATLDGAITECAAQGRRLCSIRELHSCCRTGCGLDFLPVWANGSGGSAGHAHPPPHSVEVSIAAASEGAQLSGGCIQYVAC